MGIRGLEHVYASIQRPSNTLMHMSFSARPVYLSSGAFYFPFFLAVHQIFLSLHASSISHLSQSRYTSLCLYCFTLSNCGCQSYCMRLSFRLSRRVSINLPLSFYSCSFFSSFIFLKVSLSILIVFFPCLCVHHILLRGGVCCCCCRCFFSCSFVYLKSN